LEVVRMLDQLPKHPDVQRSEITRPFGDRALRWSWYLFLLSYPWHLVGGAIAYGVTSLAGGDFGASEGVPGYVYPALYLWMMAPLVGSIVVGGLGWLKGHRPAAIVPALASATMIVIITVFGYEEFWG
jgi:fatty acid desaturase